LEIHDVWHRLTTLPALGTLSRALFGLLYRSTELLIESAGGGPRLKISGLPSTGIEGLRGDSERRGVLGVVRWFVRVLIRSFVTLYRRD
jgi:hypothetical protein